MFYVMKNCAQWHATRNFGSLFAYTLNYRYILYILRQKDSLFDIITLIFCTETEK